MSISLQHKGSFFIKSIKWEFFVISILALVVFLGNALSASAGVFQFEEGDPNYLLALSLAAAQEAEQAVDAKEQVDLDEKFAPKDFNVDSVGFLPTNPLYIFKSIRRGVTSGFTFDEIAKAELRLQFASEKLLEARELANRESVSEKDVVRALKNYGEELGRIQRDVARAAAEATDERSLELARTMMDRIIKYQKSLGAFEKELSAEAFDQVQEIKNKTAETFTGVFDLADSGVISEELVRVLDEQKGSEFKQFKNIEILKEISNKTDIAGKETISFAEKDALNKLQESVESGDATQKAFFSEFVKDIGGNEARHIEIISELEMRPVSKETRQAIANSKEGVFVKTEQKLSGLTSEQKEKYLEHLGGGEITDIRIIRELENNISQGALSGIEKLRTRSTEELRRKIEEASTDEEQQKKFLSSVEQFHDARSISVLNEIEELIPDDKKAFFTTLKQRAAEEINNDINRARNTAERQQVYQALAGDHPENVAAIRTFQKSTDVAPSVRGVLDALRQVQYQQVQNKVLTIEDKERLDRFEEDYKKFESYFTAAPSSAKFDTAVRQKKAIFDDPKGAREKLTSAQERLLKLRTLIDALPFDLGFSEGIFDPAIQHIERTYALAEKKIGVAETALEYGDVGRAYGEATAAEEIARNGIQSAEGYKAGKRAEKDRRSIDDPSCQTQWRGYVYKSSGTGSGQCAEESATGCSDPFVYKTKEQCARAQQTTVTPQCSDGRDNDNDGRIDYPADPDCYSATDIDEASLSEIPRSCVNYETENDCQNKGCSWYTKEAHNDGPHCDDPAHGSGKPTVCPAVPTISTCPSGEERVVSWSSSECGTYYACRATETATTSATRTSTWTSHTWTFNDGSTAFSQILSRTDAEYLAFIKDIENQCSKISKTNFAWKTGAGNDSPENWQNFGIPDCSGSPVNYDYVCGNNVCDPGETSALCSKDCGSGTTGTSGAGRCFYTNATRDGAQLGYSVWCEKDYYNCHRETSSGETISLTGLSLGAPSNCEGDWSGGGGGSTVWCGYNEKTNCISNSYCRWSTSASGSGYCERIPSGGGGSGISAPYALTAELSSDKKSAKLSWRNDIVTITEFKIWRSVNSAWSFLASVTKTGTQTSVPTTYTDSNLSPGYIEYQVQACTTPTTCSADSSRAHVTIEGTAATTATTCATATNCSTQASCQASNFFWYNNVCNNSPQTTTTTTTTATTTTTTTTTTTCATATNCTSSTSCAASNFYWYNNVCNSSPQTTTTSSADRCFYTNATRDGAQLGYSVWCEKDYYNCHRETSSGETISLTGLSLGAPSNCEGSWSGNTTSNSNCSSLGSGWTYYQNYCFNSSYTQYTPATSPSLSNVASCTGNSVPVYGCVSPSTTSSSCSTATNCNDSASCYASSFYWYDGYCHSSPQTSTTGTCSNATSCTDQANCTASNFFWYNNVCNNSPQTTTVSTCSTPANCTDYSSCSASGYYWANGACYSSSGGSSSGGGGSTSSCSSPSNCFDSSICTSSGWYWYSSGCWSSPQSSTGGGGSTSSCSSPGNCFDSSICTSSGWYWYSGGCWNSPQTTTEGGASVFGIYKLFPRLFPR